MYCDLGLPAEGQRHGWRFRRLKWACIAFAVVSGVVALFAWHYKSHLLWRHTASHLELQNVQAIPDRPLPDSPTPSGWIQCRVGRLEFSLPPELAGNKVAEKNQELLVTFQYGMRAVVVALPADASKFSALTDTASELCPQSRRFTMPRLRRTCYQSSSDDFRWSMTPAEVRWHAFCITTSNLIRVMPVGHTESFFRRDLDGIVHFGTERAVLDWQANDSKLGGYMHFFDNRDEADPAWIRAVCQSLKVLNEAAPEQQQHPVEE